MNIVIQTAMPSISYQQFHLGFKVRIRTPAVCHSRHKRKDKPKWIRWMMWIYSTYFVLCHTLLSHFDLDLMIDCVLAKVVNPKRKVINDRMHSVLELGSHMMMLMANRLMMFILMVNWYFISHYFGYFYLMCLCLPLSSKYCIDWMTAIVCVNYP